MESRGVERALKGGNELQGETAGMLSQHDDRGAFLQY
jgi:hypothetical protein